MTRLSTSAMAMVNAPVEQVRTALADYRTIRPRLLPDDFTDYRVEQGGQGAGTRVRWTLAVRDRKGRSLVRRRRIGKLATGAAWECVVEVDEPGEDRLIERDADGRTITWTVVPGGDGRCAVRVDASWEGPAGAAGVLARPRQQLAVRHVYEELLTALHEYFEPAGTDADGAEGAERADGAAPDPSGRAEADEPDSVKALYDQAAYERAKAARSRAARTEPAQPESGPAESGPTETTPAESGPTETTPAESGPTESGRPQGSQPPGPDRSDSH